MREEAKSSQPLARAVLAEQPYRYVGRVPSIRNEWCLVSNPANVLNQNHSDLGIPNQFNPSEAVLSREITIRHTI